MSAPVPAILYAARSKTDEDRNESTASQVEQIRTHLGEREVVGEAHVDHASGSKSNRGPGLAAAIEAATLEAERHGTAELWVYHSSRLGRGSGKKGEARALGKLLYDLREVGVAVRSVTDDEFTTNEQLWGIASSQSSKYADDLSAHIRRGYEAAAKRGDPSWICQGVLLGGYLIERTLDERGKVARKALKHPDDKWIYELIFEMVADGKSDQTIQLALSERGARTRPTTRNARSKPFDANLIAGIVTNPAYAALVRHQGKVVEGAVGKWPRYIEPEDFRRVQAERGERAAQTKRPRGRPAGYVTSGMTVDPVTGKRVLNLVRPTPYLLSGLATCGECGAAMRGTTMRRTRKDGTRIRRYVCSAHHDHHKDSAEFCAAKPIDATVAEALVVHGLRDLVSDAQRLRDQLGAGRVAQVERMGKVAAEARDDAASADRVVERAQARYERALADDDDEAADINLSAVRRARQDAEAARTRLDAALDSLNAEPEDDRDVIARVWEAITGSLADADGDVLKLNAALREWFVAFDLRQMKYTGIRVVPVISAVALARMMRGRVPEGGDYWEHVPSAFHQPSAVGYGPDGEQSHYWGDHLIERTPWSTGYSVRPE